MEREWERKKEIILLFLPSDYLHALLMYLEAFLNHEWHVQRLLNLHEFMKSTLPDKVANIVDPMLLEEKERNTKSDNKSI
ncbi:hypothetical protein LguiB_006582 [Lonicera macranthoides]